MKPFRWKVNCFPDDIFRNFPICREIIGEQNDFVCEIIPTWLPTESSHTKFSFLKKKLIFGHKRHLSLSIEKDFERNFNNTIASIATYWGNSRQQSYPSQYSTRVPNIRTPSLILIQGRTMSVSREPKRFWTWLIPSVGELRGLDLTPSLCDVSDLSP